MAKIQMFQTVAAIEPANMILILVFGNLIFEFVSFFDIQISNFTMSSGLIMPSGLSSKPDPLDPDFFTCKTDRSLQEIQPGFRELKNCVISLMEFKPK